MIKDKGKNISDSFHPAIGDHRTLMKKTDMQKKNGYFDVNYQKWAEADLMAKYDVKTIEEALEKQAEEAQRSGYRKCTETS